ncbi:hypothetical protein LTR95_014738 [Oleoguttula sp. CCFEE 5521]
MHWTGASIFARFRFRLLACATFSLLTFCYLLLPTPWTFRQPESSHGEQQITPHDGYSHEGLAAEADRDLSLPTVYGIQIAGGTASQECEASFGVDYLRAFGKTATQYCNVSSASGMLCLSNSIDGGKLDSFCLGGPAKVDHDYHMISVECALRRLTNEERSSRVPAFESFPQYWYGTGPRAIFQSFVKLEGMPATVDQAESRQAKYSLLVKREANNNNMWHEMMEIMSLTMSLDVLRITTDTITGRPLYTDEDRAKTQVVLLDNLADGPFFDLWQMTAGLPTIRLNGTTAETSELGQILVPLPGGSNPFWSCDWKELACGRSALLGAFSSRVLDFYQIQQDQQTYDRPLTVTFIERQKKRRLLHRAEYVARVQEQHPDIKIVLVDYASLPFSEQIRVTHATDILVGVHGAGLTHGMFLPPKSVIVEILPPTLNHKGFQNMAHFLGHEHVGVHSNKREGADVSGDWQQDDVFLDETVFVELMDKAIAAARVARNPS